MWIKPFSEKPLVSEGSPGTVRNVYRRNMLITGSPFHKAQDGTLPTWVTGASGALAPKPEMTKGHCSSHRQAPNPHGDKA